MGWMTSLWLLFFISATLMMVSHWCLPSLHSDQANQISKLSQATSGADCRTKEVEEFKQDFDTTDLVVHPPRSEVIVLGMHRSGTSLITGLIARMGLYTGKTLGNEATGKANPKVRTSLSLNHARLTTKHEGLF